MTPLNKVVFRMNRESVFSIDPWCHVMFPGSLCVQISRCPSLPSLHSTTAVWRSVWMDSNWISTRLLAKTTASSLTPVLLFLPQTLRPLTPSCIRQKITSQPNAGTPALLHLSVSSCQKHDVMSWFWLQQETEKESLTCDVSLCF